MNLLLLEQNITRFAKAMNTWMKKSNKGQQKHERKC
jgi:hypothetical protein